MTHMRRDPTIRATNVARKLNAFIASRRPALRPAHACHPNPQSLGSFDKFDNWSNFDDIFPSF